MVQIIKQHKVTGEIVKSDGSKFVDHSIGKISDATFAKVKVATEKSTDWMIIGQEGSTLMTREEAISAMTDKDRELKAYCDHNDSVAKAMSY